MGFSPLGFHMGVMIKRGKLIISQAVNKQTSSIHTKMNHSSLPSTGKISFSLGLDVAVLTTGVGLLQVYTQAIL